VERRHGQDLRSDDSNNNRNIDEQIKDFQDCLENCYLEVGQEKYKTCLQNCLKDKPEPQKWCQHYINFYCCHPQESQ